MNANLTSAMDIPSERPWWWVRFSLLATLILAIGVLVALFAPTPLHEWVFGAEHVPSR